MKKSEILREKAGLSEGASPEIMSWGDTFVYDPGKQSANDLLNNANGNASLKIVNTWKQSDLHLKDIQSYYYLLVNGVASKFSAA